jgi:hypothetical protein
LDACAELSKEESDAITPIANKERKDKADKPI